MNTKRIPIKDTEPGISRHIAIRHDTRFGSSVGQPPGQSMNHKRILIVDDEAGVTRSLKLNLEATAGYEVRTENDSGAALLTRHAISIRI